jgi:hypothetical protein
MKLGVVGVELDSSEQDSDQEDGKASKYQPKVLGRVFEQMKFEHKATIGKGVQT